MLRVWAAGPREGWVLSRLSASPAAHYVLAGKTGLVGCIPESMSMCRCLLPLMTQFKVMWQQERVQCWDTGALMNPC